ncbi:MULTISPECIES: hypothetical protein [Streptomyces]|uniref:hypothetical protein n=1 Tax=Streptomyces TaxID=1883 RepID=UPI002F262818
MGIIEGYASAEPFTYRAARALFTGTGWEVRMNLTVRRTPEPTAVPLPFPVPAGIIKGEKFRTTGTSYEALAGLHGRLEPERAATTERLSPAAATAVG